MIEFLGRNVTSKELFTAVAANGVFTYPDNVAGSGNIAVQVTGANGAAYTIRIRGTKSQIAPDFTLADSPANPWSYIQIRDGNTGNYFPGSTGIIVAADGTVQIDLNASIVTYFAVEISSYTAGDATGLGIIANNT